MIQRGQRDVMYFLKKWTFNDPLEDSARPSAGGWGGTPLLWLDEEGQTLGSHAADNTALVDTWFVFCGLSQPTPPHLDSPLAASPTLSALDRKSLKSPRGSLHSIWPPLVSVRGRELSSAKCVYRDPEGWRRGCMDVMTSTKTSHDSRFSFKTVSETTADVTSYILKMICQHHNY